MGSPTEPVAARIDLSTKTKLALAAEERGLTISTYLKQVIETHIDENPYDLQALNPPDAENSNAKGRKKSEDPRTSFIEAMLEDLE